MVAGPSIKTSEEARFKRHQNIYFYNSDTNMIRFVDTILIRFCSGLREFIPEPDRTSNQKSYRNRIDKSYQNRIMLILFSLIFTGFRYDLSIRFWYDFAQDCDFIPEPDQTSNQKSYRQIVSNSYWNRKNKYILFSGPWLKNDVLNPASYEVNFIKWKIDLASPQVVFSTPALH